MRINGEIKLLPGTSPKSNETIQRRAAPARLSMRLATQAASRADASMKGPAIGRDHYVLAYVLVALSVIAAITAFASWL